MTYEYVCTECQHAWEAEQSISAAPLKTCPECGKDSAKRQVSGGAGFILKGGGWYADLYSSSKPGDSKKSEASSGSSSTAASPNTSTTPTTPSSTSTTPASSTASSTTASTPTKAGGATAS